jgi:hypothetical protein
MQSRVHDLLIARRMDFVFCSNITLSPPSWWIDGVCLRVFIVIFVSLFLEFLLFHTQSGGADPGA